MIADVTLTTLILVVGATWPVTDSDVVFTMTSDSLVAKRGDKALFDLASEARNARKPFSSTGGVDTSGWYAKERWEVLSVVGTLISYEDVSDGYTGGAHPYADDSYVTRDVAKTDGKASLYDWLTEADVVAALANDGFVRKHIGNRKAASSAKTVKALFAALDPGDDCVSFDDESVARGFVFHHLEGDKAALRIALPYGDDTCRGSKTVLGILVPIGSALKGPLERAAARSEGFLMSDAKVVGAPKAAFQWEGASKNAK